jgi:hypothetical protein
MCGCETWSLTLREEQSLRMFEKRLLTKTFEPKGKKYVHNEELRDLYSSSNIIRIIKSGKIGWMGHMARRGKKRYECRALVGKRRKQATWKT